MTTMTSAFAAAVLAAGSLSCAATATAGPLTPEQVAVMAPVHQFTDGFNVGDVAAAVAACTDPVIIIDEFSPYAWHGAGAMDRWMSDYVKDAGQRGITDGVVTLHHPKHVDVANDRAYVVVPANYEFNQNGKAVKQTRSTLTVALVKTSAGWRITGWSWATN